MRASQAVRRSLKQQREQKLEAEVERLKRKNADLTREWLQQTGLIARLSAASTDPDGLVARELIYALLAALRSRLHGGAGYRKNCGCDGCLAVLMTEEIGYTEERNNGAKARNGGEWKGHTAGSQDG